MVTHRSVETSDIVKAACPALAELAAQIGDPQVRNKGTIGGSLAHADPSADYPALILALNATIHVKGPGGDRSIQADDYFQGLFETALKDNEIITGVRFPSQASGTGSAYAKAPNPASRYAVVGVAARVAVDARGTCISARIGVTGAASSAFRASAIEQALVGTDLSASAIAAAADQGVTTSGLLNDLSASAQYRAHLVKVMARKALSAAAGRATS
jgi:carbon-monoxide dehydrogenase medium subunit